MLNLRAYRRLGRRGVLAAAGAVLAAPSIVRAQGSNGVALVIGNSKYRWEVSLPNVKRDVADVARAVQALGLKTELVQDVDAEAMRAAVEKFSASANGAEFAVFYFAGHGAFRHRSTNIVPIDADLSDPATAKGLIESDTLIRAMKGARHRMLVFDACRNNPADGWRQRSSMLQTIVTSPASWLPPDTLVLYSTAPGRVALDGPPGENSIFAATLLRQLAAPPIDLQTWAVKMRPELLIATEGRQFVWDITTFSQTVSLGRAGATARTSAGAAIDSARLVRFDKAYDYVRSNQGRLRFPEGLLAIRPRAGAPHADKIGTFRFEGRQGVPSVLAILSVDGDTANVVFASSVGVGQYGWTLYEGKLSGRDMTLAQAMAVDNLGTSVTVHWHDANTGTLAIPGRPVFSTSFTRLDG